MSLYRSASCNWGTAMEAKLWHNFNLLPCANHNVIGVTRLPLGPICANQSLSLAEFRQSNFVTSQAPPIKFPFLLTMYNAKRRQLLHIVRLISPSVRWIERFGFIYICRHQLPCRRIPTAERPSSFSIHRIATYTHYIFQNDIQFLSGYYSYRK